MPSITNLTLELQHSDPANTRRARVRFLTNFSSIERLARATFKADVRIVSDDNDRNIVIGSTYIQADSTPVSSNVTRLLTRANLDEDADIFIPSHGGIPQIIERRDEWVARVTLTPVTFETTAATSPLVTGSWGIRGDD